MNNDNKMIEEAKMIYYSNSIIFTDKEMGDKCRKTNNFYEFMQGTFAKKIEIELNEDNNVCLNILEESNHRHNDEVKVETTRLDLAKYEDRISALSWVNFKNQATSEKCQMWIMFNLNSNRSNKQMSEHI